MADICRKAALKLNRLLLIVALAYLLFNGLFYWQLTAAENSVSLAYILLGPIVWLITFVIVIVLCLRHRSVWFRRDILLSTLIGIILCTPLVPLGALYLMGPDSHMDSTGYDSRPGYMIKIEHWNYNSGEPAAKKYWKRAGDGKRYDDEDEGFKKDSTWTYFNKKGDTIKTETYHNDSLVKTKVYK
jgi:hypothetical protein